MFGLMGLMGGGGGGSSLQTSQTISPKQTASQDFGSSRFGGDINVGTGAGSGGSGGLGLSPLSIGLLAVAGLIGLFIWKR